MWKDYSVGFIRKNRASGISIAIAALIASLFLSFLCSFFYNLWVYEIDRLVMEEGDWQGRISGELDEADLSVIRNFGNVERAEVNAELSGDDGVTVDIIFCDARTIFQDMPQLTKRLGMEEDAASYHLQLLSGYLIHDPQDETPPLLLTFYLVILLLVSLSLILVIRNSFAVSMNARVHQFGIFSSIGATPAQIRICLLQEALALCALPVLIGSAAGTLLMNCALGGMNAMAGDIAGRHEAVFQFHPLIFAAAVLISLLTVIFSAWMPAWKLSRMTPLESIRNAGETRIVKRNPSRIPALLFGFEGELAGNALKAQKKALRTSTISLTLSFAGFTMMSCLFALTDLSTRYTYVEKYQDAWDVMVTVKNTGIEDFKQIEEIRRAKGAQDCAVYQKESAVIAVPEGNISGELAALGGPEAVAGPAVSREGQTWLVQAPLIILDDAAFETYCEQAGIEFRPDGTVILNRIWDSLHSKFRYREYVPFVNENMDSIVLENADTKEKSAQVPVLGFTREVPILKEEYADYSLVQFIPLSLWRDISAQIGGRNADTLIRVLGREDAGREELDALETDILRLIGPSYEVESENRIEDKISNDNIIAGYKLIVGIFCFLLAAIGIANVFSYTLGFIRQRKREFAQYMSIGLTPAGMCRMFCIEAFVIAGRPILLTLPLTAAFVVYMSRASVLKLAEVLPELPVLQIMGFCLMIVLSVALAYYIGGRRMMNYGLADALRDDTMA